ncbi:MAG TPA: Fe-Mn family superoxide dismutase [Candidatus Cybelea sp.]|jgi:Fe-Mn family superoxide dismutase|nr:Fe-Mn family superoxide dismutase [Candidatus Cybelea sp.]
MDTITTAPYVARKWTLSGLQGISDQTLELHFGLYEGYVKNANGLNERIASLRAEKKNSGADPAYAELVRRLGWEFDGMRLHEYYFDNLTTSPRDLSSGRLHEVIGSGFGSIEDWKKDFAAIGAMRGIGWAVLYYDPAAKRLLNVWIGDHDLHHLAGCEPIVVMDLWEHAWLKDYKPADKSKYIEAFVANIDWTACEGRLR